MALFIYLLVMVGSFFLINVKDVVTLYVPYPDSSSIIAHKPHMYICIRVTGLLCEMVKCQSFKPYHATPGTPPTHRIIEHPDPLSNPFKHPTVIDLDKIFVVTHSLIHDKLKASRGVGDAIYDQIIKNLSPTAPRITFSDADLRTVNYKL